MKPSITTVVLAVSGWIALAATTLPGASPVRIIATLGFVVFCPGAALMRIVTATMRDRDRYEPLLAAALTVAASLAVATLTSEAFFLSGTYTMVRCVIVLAALTSLATLVAAVLPKRSRSERTSRVSWPR